MKPSSKKLLFSIALFAISCPLVFLTTYLIHQANSSLMTYQNAMAISSVYSSIVTCIDIVLSIVFLAQAFSDETNKGYYAEKLEELEKLRAFKKSFAYSGGVTGYALFNEEPSKIYSVFLTKEKAKEYQKDVFKSSSIIKTTIKN
jgi:hypothetical protein